MKVEVLIQLSVLSGPAFATGRVVFTLTVTLELAVHPFEPVTVTVYIVFVPGLAIGWGVFVELKPTEGDHAYEFPDIAVVPRMPDVMLQFKFKLDPAFAIGNV